jgi:hypothetical protein
MTKPEAAMGKLEERGGAPAKQLTADAKGAAVTTFTEVGINQLVGAKTKRMRSWQVMQLSTHDSSRSSQMVLLKWNAL